LGIGLAGASGKWCTSRRCTSSIARARPFFEALGAKGLAHAGDERIPLRLRNVPRQATVSDDLDRVFGQQQVDQYAVVVFGIPDAELAEHRDRALPRAWRAPQVGQRQAGFDAQADLAAVLLLAGSDAGFQARKPRRRVRAPCRSRRACGA
jgi:hypothetical protein